MLRRLFIKSTGVPLVVVGCLGFAHTALAGFQWVAPVEEPLSVVSPESNAPSAAPEPLTPAPAAPTLSAPVATEAPAPSPVIVSGATASAPVVTPSVEAPVVETPVAAAPVVVPEPAPAPVITPVIVNGTSPIVPRSPSTAAPRIISPIVIGGAASSPAPTPLTPAPVATPSPETVEIPAHSGAVSEAAPVAEATVVTPEVKPATPIIVPAATPDVVHGFAKNVPVVVAVRQILPAGYTFTIDQNVDMGTLVSFQGGKPWKETLNNALLPAGLVVHEQGQSVQIGYAGDNKPQTKPAAVVAFQPGMEPHALESKQFVKEEKKPELQPQADVQAVPEIKVDEPQAAAVVVPSPSPTVPEVPAPKPLPAVAATTPALPAPVVVSSTTSEILADSATETWTAERGTTLHKVLSDWCHRTHVEFNWIAEYDYPINASITYNGSFQDAVRAILSGFESAHPQPVAELHSNAGMGQMVLVVRTRGNTDAD